VLLACALLRPGAVGGQEPSPQPRPLSAAQRAHFQTEEFSAVGRVAVLPAALRQGLQELFGAPSLELAEPGAEFQATDVISKPNLPIRRLILAGCSADHCLVQYERGGIAHTYQVALFSLSKSAAKLDWGGRAPGPAGTLGQLKEMVLAGEVDEKSAYW
jgi:hypothetical protein